MPSSDGRIQAGVAGAGLRQGAGKKRMGRLRRMFHQMAGSALGIVLIVTLAWPLKSANAGVLEFEPFVTTGVGYTDNLFLASPGEHREDDYILELEPGFRLGYRSLRLNADVDYRVQGLIYAEHSDMNHAYHQLNANATLEAIHNWFFIDGRARYDHQIIDPKKVGGRRNLFGGGNRTSIALASVSPYLRHSFGAVGVATLRYGYARAHYDDNIPDTTSNTWTFLLARPEEYGPVTYDLYYRDQRLIPEEGRDRSFKRARLGLQWHLTERTALVGNVGRENDYKPNGTVDELGASFWNAGVTWNAESDTLKLLYGHRFFGASYEFDWQHEGADFHSDVSYKEEPTNYNRQLLQSGSLTSLSRMRLPRRYNRLLPSLRNRRIFVRKRAQVGLTFDLSNSQIQLRLYRERRNYVRLAETEDVEGARISWKFALGLHDSLTPSYGYHRYEFRDEQINYRYQAEVKWTHDLADDLDLSVRARNEKRHSVKGRGYTVNTLMLELTKHF